MMKTLCLWFASCKLLFAISVLRACAQIAAVLTIKATTRIAAVVATSSRCRIAQRRLRSTGSGSAGQNRSIIQESLQVGGQFLGGCIATRGILGHRLQDDRLQVSGNGWIDPARLGGFIQRDLAEQLLMIATVEGRPQRQKLVECHTERIDVGALVHDTPPRQGLLGAHVTQRADHVSGMRQAQITGKPRQPKIGDPKRPVSVDQQIGRFDITMQNAKAMRVVEGFGRLNAKLRDVATERPIVIDRPVNRGAGEQAWPCSERA